MIEAGSIFYFVIVGVAVLVRLLRDRSPARVSRSRSASRSLELPAVDSASTAQAQPLIQAYLTEYQTLREEQLKRVEFASQVQIYGVILLGAIVPLVQYVDYVGSNGGDGYVLFLLAALVFCALGWYQLDLDDKFAELDNYLLLVLKPNLKSAMAGSAAYVGVDPESVMDWHLYWRMNRYRSVSGIWLSLGVIGRAGVAVLGASALLGAYIYFEHAVLQTPWYVSRILLVAIVAFAIIWMLISGTLVRNKLAHGTEAYRLGLRHV